MRALRKISYYDREIRGRVDSGPVQFGDDWPGVFLAAETARGFAEELRTLLDAHKRHPGAASEMTLAVLEGLYKYLKAPEEAKS